MRAKEVLAVLADSGCYLPEGLQLGPSTGPFDFQYCTDELFISAGQGRYQRQWKNYLDDFLIATGVWRGGRAYTDEEHRELLQSLPSQSCESRPLTAALEAAGLPTRYYAARRISPRAP